LNIPETPRSGRRLRLLVAALVSVGLLVPLAALGAGTSGQTASAAQYKITICHHTHSKKHPMVTIRISNKAWPAHQRHGDTMGACTTAKAKHGKSHQNGDKGKSHQNANKPDQKGNNGKSGTNPSSSQAQSPSHANEHANDHAKGHGK
jgi:hypothetical protein